MGISATRRRLRTATWIAAINVDVMTTATVMTVGARWQCPRTQENRRGLGVAQDPDKWLTMRTVSAGSGHGPILLGKSEAGGGSIASTQRPINSYVNLQGDFIPHAEIFYIGRVKKISNFGKKSAIDLESVVCDYVTSE